MGHYRDIKELLAKANELKSGDQMAGLAAASASERVAAKMALAEIPLCTLFENPVVPYEKDEITRLAVDSLDAQAYGKIKNLTVSEFREWILQDTTSGEDILKISP